MHGALPFFRSRAPKPQVLHFSKAGNDESLEDDERLPDTGRVDPAREEQCDAVQRPDRIAGDDEPDRAAWQRVSAQQVQQQCREWDQAQSGPTQ